VPARAVAHSKLVIPAKAGIQFFGIRIFNVKTQ